MLRWTNEEFLAKWQEFNGEIDVKWHDQFLNSSITQQILEFESIEIQYCLENPDTLTDYVGIYREPIKRKTKKLSEILEQLHSEIARRDRQPLGTFSHKKDATGSSNPIDTWIGTNINLSHDDQ